MKKFLLLLSLFFVLTNSNAQNVVFAQLTGTPIDTTGWHLTGNAVLGNTAASTGNNSEVILSAVAAGYQSGAIFCTQPINIVACDKWTTEFDFRMFDGSGADGIAFCVLDVPPTGFVSGGGVGIPSASNGLKVVFDTYNNSGPPNPSIQIRYGAGYAGGEANTAQPTLDNTSGQLSFLRSTDYNTARIEYNAGQIDVYVNNTLYLSGNYAITFSNAYIGFTASTGGSNDNHSIKNVYIRADMPLAEAGAAVSACPNQPMQLGTVADPAYHYQWTPSTGLSNDTIANPVLTLPNNGTTPLNIYYKVGVNELGISCVRYDSVLVTVNPIPTSSFVVSAQHCVGQNVQISYTGSAAPNATYDWNFNGGSIASGSGAGPYNVVWPIGGDYNIILSVTDEGCLSNTNVQTITVDNLPVAHFNYEQSYNYNMTFTSVSEGNNSVHWDLGNIGSSNQTPTQFDFPGPGSYPLSLIVTNACGSDTLDAEVYVLQLTTGLNYTSKIKGISMFPNPAEYSLTIKLDGYNDVFNYCITDIGGKVITCQNKLQGPQATIDVSTIASGMYFITLDTTEGRAVSKLVKQ